jgi:hypothetical protein
MIKNLDYGVKKKLKKKLPSENIKQPVQFEIYGKQTEKEKSKNYFLPIKASEPGSLQFDIADMRRLYSPQNNNVKYLFLVVDVCFFLATCEWMDGYSL